MGVTIHWSRSIDWHGRAVSALMSGLGRLGIECAITDQRHRISEDPAILLGTTLFKGIEATAGDWLLVDRASIGDPDYVQLVWNGRGYLGNHKVPDTWNDTTRGELCDRARALNVELYPKRATGLVLLCGEHEDTHEIREFYGRVGSSAQAFRPHPHGLQHWDGVPTSMDLDNVLAAHVWRSSIGVELVCKGVTVIPHSKGSMVWPMYQSPGMRRETWLNWLSHTQWKWSEIADGHTIRHIFD